MMQWTRHCICHLRGSLYRSYFDKHQVFKTINKQLPCLSSQVHTSVHVASHKDGENVHTKEETNMSTPSEKQNQRNKKPISETTTTDNKSVIKLDKALTAQYFESKWLESQSSTINRQFSETDALSEVSSKGQSRPSNIDTDMFGNLVVQGSHSMDQRHPNERISEQLPKEEKDRDFRLGIPLTRDGRIGKTAFYYTKKMSKLGKQGQIREAIYIFDEIMMKRDRVLPNKRTFVTLIGILGRVGYTRKAFQLFREMKKLGFDAEDHIYTSLFNACANSPSSDDGLARAEKFIRYLQENNIKLNLYSVKSCMKALAVCGDFPRAFAVLDEASTRMQLDSGCFNSLLFACVADKKAGFLRALLVWQKMLEMQICPETSTFNLLLRCVRDCRVGEPDKFQHLLGHTDGGSDLHHSVEARTRLGLQQTQAVSKTFPLTLEHFDVPKSTSQHTLGITGDHVGRLNPESSVTKDSQGSRVSPDNWTKDWIQSLDEKSENVIKQVKTGSSECAVEGSSSDRGLSTKWWEDEGLHSSAISHVKENANTFQQDEELEVPKASKLSMKDLEKAEVRLAFLGGAQTFLLAMSATGALPDVKTFTQLLSCSPNDEDSEIALLSAMEEMGTRPDVDFLNDCMMRRYRRRDHQAFEAVLMTMSNLGLSPNMRTYAALGLTCNTRDKADQLLEDMKAAGVEPSPEVMGHLFLASSSNFAYKLHLLKIFEALGYQPTTRILTLIEKAIAVSKRRIVQAEKDGDIDNFYLGEAFTGPFKYFLNYYRHWLQRTEISRPEHPWKAFEPSSEDVTDLKLPLVQAPRKQRL